MLGESQANLFKRAPKKRVFGKRIDRDVVEESYPAVEETSHAVEESSHGGLFLRPAAPPKIDAT